MIAFSPLSPKLALLLAILAAALTFLFDLTQPLGVAGGMPYVLLPLLGLLARSSVIVVFAAALGTLLTGLGLLHSPDGAQMTIVYTNRGMSIVLLWVVALTTARHLQIGNNLRSQLSEQAATDPLTGLYNRRYVFAYIDEQLKRFERYNEYFSLILMDADHFKHVNDTYGHVTGDATLRMIAEVCMRSVRDIDVVGRFGGEEFVIVLPRTSATEATLVAERIRSAVKEAGNESKGAAVPVTLSLGVAEVGLSTATFDDLLAEADKALYAAKEAGRNRVVTRATEPTTPATADAA